MRGAAAVSLLVAEHGAAGAGGALAELEWLAEVPVTAIARALVRCAAPDVSPALSAKRQAQLEAAARRLDRISGPGEWVRVAGRVVEAWTEGEPFHWCSAPARSLGALALELRREANVRRWGMLERHRQRLRPLASMRERNKVKRWRAELRLLEREHPGGGWSLRRPRER